VLTVWPTGAGLIIAVALVVDLHTFGYFAHECPICPSMHHLSLLSGSGLEHAVTVTVPLPCP